MKIIRLGKLNVQFICSNCHTMFEANTDELIINKNINDDKYSIICPLCGTTLCFGDNFIAKFLKKKLELEEEMHKKIEDGKNE